LPFTLLARIFIDIFNEVIFSLVHKYARQGVGSVTLSLSESALRTERCLFWLPLSEFVSEERQCGVTDTVITESYRFLQLGAIMGQFRLLPFVTTSFPQIHNQASNCTFSPPLLGLQVRSPLEGVNFRFLFLLCCVGSSVCESLSTRSEEPYRARVCLIVCDLET
jgi:hypothetical protein